MGEEDLFSRVRYSCTCKCYSLKGTVYELSKDEFIKLKNSETSWLSIMEKIIHKESRSQATHIKSKPRDFAKEMKIEEKERERVET